MKTDQEILNEGVKTLFAAMNVIDAERFMMLVQRNNFDYTEWQRRLWADDALETIYQRAAARWEAHACTIAELQCGQVG